MRGFVQFEQDWFKMGHVGQGIAILVDKIGLDLSKLILVGPNLARCVQLRQGGFKLVRV